MTAPQTASSDIQQLSLLKILVMHLWPAIAFGALIYGVGPRVFGAGLIAPSWFVLAVMVVGNGLELAVGTIGIYRAGRRRVRFMWRRRSYVVAVFVLIIGFALSNLAVPLQAYLAQNDLLGTPNWWPAASNPNVPKRTIGDAFPDIDLPGNYSFLVAFVMIGLVFNVLGEEVYYRGYLLPRMRGVFGQYDWIASSLLFTAKHVYQPWSLPGVLVGAVCFGIAAGPLRSLRLAIAYHWIGNYLLPAGVLLLAVV